MKYLRLHFALALALARPVAVLAGLVNQEIVLLDDNGTPLPGITVEATSTIGWVPGTGFGRDLIEKQTATSNREGIAKFSLPAGTGTFSYQIQSSDRCYYQRWQLPVRNDNKKAVIFCKSVQRPVAMYIRMFDQDPIFWNWRLPSLTAPCELDLIKADWLPPFGRGERADISFQWCEKERVRAMLEPYDVTLKVSFPGLGNGLIWTESLELGTTEMPLPRTAPSEGYQPEIKLRMWRAEKGGTQTNFYWTTERRIGYFFRIRSELDEQGAVRSANYGKLVGGIAFRPNPTGQVWLNFQYFLNPNANDRNMEHRLDANLFPDADAMGRRK